MPPRSKRSPALWYVTLIALVYLAGCKRLEKDLPPAVTDAVRAVQQQHCPDRRLCVFDIEVVMLGANLKLQGELSDSTAIAELITAVKKAAPNFKVEEEIRLLPDPALGNRRFGLVRPAVANLRSKPGHAAELAHQLLMGSMVSLLKKEGHWYYLQTEDGYLGWLPEGSFKAASLNGIDEWLASDLVAYNRLDGLVREEANAGALPIAAVVLGCTMRRLEVVEPKAGHARQKWVKVRLPDRREGFVEFEAVAERDKIFPVTPGTAEDIVKTAKRFLGISYLWGGASVNGFDCSGFTQHVFRLHGVGLLRDASQQARQGEALDPGRDFENLQPADLLFFGEQKGKITHVAISLGGARFIHASDFVQMNSLDEHDADYVDYRRQTFQFAKRMTALKPAPSGSD